MFISSHEQIVKLPAHYSLSAIMAAIACCALVFAAARSPALAPLELAAAATAYAVYLDLQPDDSTKFKRFLIFTISLGAVLVGAILFGLVFDR